MGDWVAVALSRVAQEDVAGVLSDLGSSWEEALHVTATTTLTGAIRDAGAAALPVATLRDLVVMPALPGRMRLPLRAFRNPALSLRDDREGYERAVRDWQTQATGRRLRTGVQVDDSLRSFVRSKADNALGRALVASRRTYASTIHTLIASGVRPQDLRPADAVAQLAVRAWERAERDVPSLGAPRELMWLDDQELSAGTSERAQRLKAGLRAALDAAFGPAVDGRRTLVHHGFYFYTPAQWQLFQVLRALDEVDQVFVVHDDGANPAFAVWRYYFRPEWGMPVPGPARPPAAAVTPAAAWLRGVLSGGEEGDLVGVRLVEYGSPVDLVRDWATETEQRGEDGVPPVRYAAAATEVERFVQRLGRSEDVAGPHLSQLPVGTFLLALHACVERDRAGRVQVVLTPERVLDMVSSGFVRAESQGVRTPVVRRALGYFGDCREPQQWLERAAMLVRTVTERVERLGGRSPADSDADRIDAAASNPVRLAPWVDLTHDEAAAVADLVERVVALVEEVVSRERVRLGDHLERVRGTLEGVLKGLGDAERRVVEAKLNGFGVLTGEEVDVDALVDVVAMLLGRTADFDHGRSEDDDPGESSRLRQLRGLDCLGLRRTDQALHLTNLAEDVFPAGASSVGWPFTLADVRSAVDHGLEPVAAELLSTRAATAPLGDLYLLWLALDGVSGGADLTLSWISRAAGGKRRLSPLAALLARLRHPDAAVRDLAGGLEPVSPERAAAREALGLRPAPGEETFEDDVMTAVEDAVHPVAAASAWACPRRFALQWVAGPSAGFGPEYLTTMLYGNLTRALVREGHENVLGARATTGSVWVHLTDGQRASSLDKAVVKAAPGEGGPGPEWIWTLAGSGRGARPLDAAYQAAQGRQCPDFELLAPPGSEFLPAGVTGDDAPDVCAKCPVQTRCLHWQEPQR